MGKVRYVVSSLLLMASWSFAQQSPLAEGEARSPVTVRALYSTDADLAVPLCPQTYHDSLKTDGIAGPRDKGVHPPKTKKTAFAKMTEAAIEAANNTHVGNFLVIVNVLVDAKGNPGQVCLLKSSGYGLDASAAAAVGQYRFRPASKHGKSVPMRIPVSVRFVNPEAELEFRSSSGEQSA